MRLLETPGEYKPRSKKQVLGTLKPKNFMEKKLPEGYETQPLGQDDGDGTGEPLNQTDTELEEGLEEAGGAGGDESGENVELDSEEDSPEEDFDFKTELEKERERLGRKIAAERSKRNAEKNAKGATLEQVQKMVDDRVSIAEKRVLRSRAEELADRLAKTDAERELILHHFDHSIVPSGSLEDDIENAYALANRRKFKQTISELKAAARSKQNRIGSSGAGAPAAPAKKLPKYTQEDVDGAKFAGVTIEEFVKARIENEQKV